MYHPGLSVERALHGVTAEVYNQIAAAAAENVNYVVRGAKEREMTL